MAFLEQPIEIFGALMPHLHFRDVLSLSQACRALYNSLAAAPLPFLWRTLNLSGPGSNDWLTSERADSLHSFLLRTGLRQHVRSALLDCVQTPTGQRQRQSDMQRGLELLLDGCPDLELLSLRHCNWISMYQLRGMLESGYRKRGQKAYRLRKVCVYGMDYDIDGGGGGGNWKIWESHEPSPRQKTGDGNIPELRIQMLNHVLRNTVRVLARVTDNANSTGDNGPSPVAEAAAEGILDVAQCNACYFRIVLKQDDYGSKSVGSACKPLLCVVCRNWKARDEQPKAADA